MIVYKITNILNGKVYVGQTVGSLKRRWNQHCSSSTHCVALRQAIQKYGRENFVIEQIDQADNVDELNKKEVDWIINLNSLSPNGYNLTSGGLNCLRTDDFKKKQSKFRHTEEARKRMSDIAKGRRHSKESKLKMSESRKGLKLSQNHIEKVRANSTTKKSVIRNDGVVFLSIGDAARSVNGTTSGISRVLSGLRNKHRGYSFKYVEVDSVQR